MAKLGATTFESELRAVLGGRGTGALSGTTLTRYRKEGYWWVARIPRLTEFTRVWDFTVAVGTVSTTMPADLRAIYRIQERRPYRHRIKLVPRSYLDRRTLSAGDVYDAARQDRTIWWGNSLSAATGYRVTYQATPTVPSGTTVHAYAEELEHLHLMRSAYVGFVEQYGEERATSRKAFLDEALAELGYDPRKVEQYMAVQAIETDAKDLTIRLRTE